MTQYSQYGREGETYVARYKCHACKGMWCGRVTGDPARPGEYPLAFNYCPCCGARFSGETPRLQSTERRRELLAEAYNANHRRAEARRIRYEIQTRAEHRDRWQQDGRYYNQTSRQDVVHAWRQRLRERSWFAEEVRLVAFTPSGAKVVFGPVRLEADNNVDCRQSEETP